MLDDDQLVSSLDGTRRGGLISSVELPRDAPAVRPSLHMLELWDNWSGSGLPLRSYFPPENFGKLMGRVSLLEPVKDGADFIYRLYSGIAANKGGMDFTGMHVSEMPYPDYAAALIQQNRQCLVSGRPTIHENRFIWRNRTYGICCVRLPVRDKPDGPDMLMVIDLHANPNKRPDTSDYIPNL
ncbi:PAS domain-containing protein [Nisaea nitritireducens]|uniref:hypothetical protein n=1 Tax=Nisaea nitritireducens TaxID=568392 RepID=UPI001867388A|nr:hypothetical protein [Nisaea nitritireducens]